MSTGNIVEVIGAVVDVEFPRNAVPAVYDALTVADQGLTLEVQQQLGDGIVRTIAMGASDGLKRGMKVDNTGAPISVPVGMGTVGRIMDVLGMANCLHQCTFLQRNIFKDKIAVAFYCLVFSAIHK